MDSAAFYRMVYRCLTITKNAAPYDTGNLRNDATRIVWESQNTVRIYVDDSIAPYMPYTNEPWVSPMWHGRKNPNQYWFDRAAQAVKDYIAQETGSEGKRADTPKTLSKLQTWLLSRRFHVTQQDILINSAYLTPKHGTINDWP
jgi:hypothetical protein